MKKNLLVPFVALTLTVSLGLSGCSSASSRAKEDAIAKVNAMPEIGGAHKQEILERIDRAESPVVIQGIVDQAQAENDKLVDAKEKEEKTLAENKKKAEAAKESFVDVTFVSNDFFLSNGLTFKLAKDGKVEKSGKWEEIPALRMTKIVSWKFPDEQPGYKSLLKDGIPLVSIELCEASGECTPWVFTGSTRDESEINAGPRNDKSGSKMYKFQAQR